MSCCASPRPDCMGMCIPEIGNRCEALQEKKWATEAARGMGRTYHWIRGLSTGEVLLHVTESEARMMAAAPDLLASLQSLIRAGHGLTPASTEWRDAHAAIGKATDARR